MTAHQLPSLPSLCRPNHSGAHIEEIQDSKLLRNTLGSFATGVTVITTLARDGTPLGITVNSFASVSLEPPLVLWSQLKRAPSHREFLEAGTIVINVLSAHQRQLSQHFSRPSPDKFADIEYTPAPCGAPVLEGCAATFICRAVDHYYGGDHTIHLCKVESFHNHFREPLIFCRGAYLESDLLPT